MKIRNSAKAVIIQDKKLLAIKKEDTEGYYFLLPEEVKNMVKTSTKH
jgi:8-oxo-dGTP diphosphatase